METDNSRRGFQQQCQHLVILDEALVDRAKRCRRLRSIFMEQWRHRREPRGLAGGILRHWSMNEDIDVERAITERKHASNHFSRTGCIGGSYANRAERASITDGGC